MTWYAASIIIGMKPSNGPVSSIIVLENIMLVEADSSEAAYEKASQMGKEEASLDDGLTVKGQPAVRQFAGIRKLISVSNPPPYDQDEDRPTNGTEITYSVYEVADEDALAALAKGQAVTLNYVE